MGLNNVNYKVSVLCNFVMCTSPDYRNTPYTESKATMSWMYSGIFPSWVVLEDGNRQFVLS